MLDFFGKVNYEIFQVCDISLALSKWELFKPLSRVQDGESLI